MRIGKVKESILKRSVLRQLHNHSEQGSPASGEDAGVLFIPEFMPEFTQGFSGKNGVAIRWKAGHLLQKELSMGR